MGYLDIAEPLAARGIPTIPLRPKTKIAILPEWEKLATTDPFQMMEWDDLYPDANVGCVALAKTNGVWFFEVDRPEVLQRVESETGQKLPKTFRVRSSPGRGHFYFKQSSASLEMGNISQNFVKGGDWSARVSNAYVVAPGSLHPKTGLPYEVVSTADLVECPDWLINWLKSQKQDIRKSQYTLDGTDKIPYGSHDTALASIAGKLRAIGMEENALATALTEVCEKRCENYGEDYKDMCAKIAKSICRYAVPDNTIIINGKVAGTEVIQKSEKTNTAAIEVIEPPVIARIPYPHFPIWAMQGTSLYEGFAKPYCDVNCRYPEFMWMPAMTILLNYVGTRVRLSHNRNLIPSIFLTMIGRRGEVLKSSSAADAMSYFEYMGFAAHGGPGLKNAEGKSVIYTVGSPEGLGIEMARLNCRNSILYYDELSALTSKASIESSSLTSSLLLLYESAKFANQKTSRKDSYSIDPGTYCTSLIACSTDTNFLSDWSKLSGKSSGLDDRFFFLFQPEKFKPRNFKTDVNILPSVAITKARIEKALSQKEYKITNTSPLSIASELGTRVEVRAEKFALGIAIDLGRDEIDEDCLERALALVQYETQVKKYLQTYEAVTREGSIQNEIMHTLRKAAEPITVGQLNKVMRPEKYGTSLWGQSFNGLLQHGWIRVEGDTKKIILLRIPEEE